MPNLLEESKPALPIIDDIIKNDKFLNVPNAKEDNQVSVEERPQSRVIVVAVMMVGLASLVVLSILAIILVRLKKTNNKVSTTNNVQMDTIGCDGDERFHPYPDIQ